MNVLNDEIIPFWGIRLDFTRSIYSEEWREIYPEELENWYRNYQRLFDSVGRDNFTQSYLQDIDRYYDHHKQAAEMFNDFDKGFISLEDRDKYIGKGRDLSVSIRESLEY